MRKTFKTTYICPNCKSNRIQQKTWVNLNDNSVDWDGASDLCDDEDYYCQDCEEHLVPVTLDLPARSKIIGFQVVSDQQDIHPNMAGSFCIYSLSQAKEMVEDDLADRWHLLCIWKGDVEEPTFMFEGDPRD
jgi:uncharacterized protein YlaI